MATNVTPDYIRAERAFRAAESHDDKLAALEDMLRFVPKHKASEKLQADIKRKLSHLRREGPKKAATHHDVFHVPKQGGGQVVLLGTPNTGKSAIVGALTKASVNVTDFPFGTHAPVPGIAYHEDVPIQLLDMPPITADHVPPGMVGRLRQADVLALVVDLAADTVLEDVDTCLSLLEAKNLGFQRAESGEGGLDDSQPAQPVLCVGTKSDLEGADDNLAVLTDLYGSRLEFLAVSTTVPANLATLVQRLFELLAIVRIYAKQPGKPADKTSPFLLPHGSTVIDMARTVHREFADTLKYARVWGATHHDGQQVAHDHVLEDKDVVELHV